MELKTLRALTLKHINLSINMLNNPGLFNTSDSSFNILIEEQIFITLAFVGSFLERSNKNIYKDKTLLGYKYLWNYSKHGETPFKFVALDVKPSFTFPLVITKKFIFGKAIVCGMKCHLMMTPEIKNSLPLTKKPFKVKI